MEGLFIKTKSGGVNKTLNPQEAALNQFLLWIISSCSCLRNERHAIVVKVMSVVVTQKA